MAKCFCSVIIVAAGKGLRFDSKQAKQFLLLNNKEILVHTLDVFESLDIIDEIVLVLSNEYLSYFQNEINIKYCFKKIKLVEGGKERQDSVLNGINSISEKCDVILVHDGVRPFVKKGLVIDVINKALEEGACVPAVRVKDTIKECCDGQIIKTLDRSKLYNIQTPQGFKADILKSCYKNIGDDLVTDDSSLLERMNRKVAIVEGDYLNIKITTKEDLLFGEAILKKYHNN